MKTCASEIGVADPASVTLPVTLACCACAAAVLPRSNASAPTQARERVKCIPLPRGDWFSTCETEYERERTEAGKCRTDPSRASIGQGWNWDEPYGSGSNWYARQEEAAKRSSTGPQTRAAAVRATASAGGWDGREIS